MKQETIKPEFSVEVDLISLGRGEKLFRLAANDDERSKIAHRLCVIAVENLEGEIRLTVSKTQISAVGSVRARLIRECVASLEPMTEDVNENFEIRFMRQAPKEPDLKNDDSEGWNLSELHEGEVFDVGELLVQQLSLAMAAFPRKQGASSLAEQYGRTGSDSPFSELRAVLKKDNNKQ